MEKKKFDQCSEDKEFRKVMAEAIDSANKEIIVITGEFSAYNFPDLKQKVHEALARNIKMKVYANSPSPSDINDIKERGGEVYIGDISAKNHYTVIDNNTVIISEKEGITLPRHGCVYEDAEYAEKITEFFDDLVGMCE